MSGYTRRYHISHIQKGELGHFSKVWEEFEELKDSSEQDLVLMCLCEISDILGALYAIPKISIYTDITTQPILNGQEYITLLDLKSDLHVLQDTLSTGGSDIISHFTSVIQDLYQLTHQYKTKLSFEDIKLFSKKTKEACYEDN